jgi:hypothetical protein
LKIVKEDKFLLHLEAIRHFVLFEQGDFALLLIDLLKTGLAKPSHHLYRINLLSNVDTAVSFSSSYLKGIPEIVENLDVKILEVS